MQLTGNRGLYRMRAAGDGGQAADDTSAWPTIDAVKFGQQKSIPLGGGPGGPNDSPLQPDGEGVLKTADGAVWVPDVDDLRLRLLVIAHAGAAGHRGVDATYQALSTRFWWPELHADCTAFVQDCLQCVKCRAGTVVPRPPGEQIVATRPVQVLHFDYLFMGPGTGGMTYLLVLKDGFSGTIELVPSGSATADVVAQALLAWCGRYGTPAILVSDQGPHFKNKIIDSVRAALKVEHHFVTPLAAWANGTIERANRECLRTFRVLLGENRMGKEKWPYLVAPVQIILNQSPSARLGGVSPLEVMTGMPPVHPLDTVALFDADELQVGELSVEAVHKHLTQVRAAFESMHAGAAEAGAKRRAANKRAAAKRGVVPHADFDVGDFVLAARMNPDKLSARWLGPYRVSRVVDDWTFEVEDLVRGVRLLRHARMLMPYSDRTLGVNEDLRQQIQHDDSHSYLVDSIVDWRETNGKFELLVRWLGFDPESDTWEPLDVLMADTPDLVRKFVTGSTSARKNRRLQQAVGL
jgi:transposase InsO family protein